MITIPDLFGHLFYAIIFIGTRKLHKKNKWGWALRVAGDIGWVGLGIYMGYTSIMVWSSVFAINDFTGWYRWNEKEKYKRSRNKTN